MVSNYQQNSILQQNVQKQSGTKNSCSQTFSQDQKILNASSKINYQLQSSCCSLQMKTRIRILRLFRLAQEYLDYLKNNVQIKKQKFYSAHQEILLQPKCQINKISRAIKK
ncbi:unnamed protein product [Paramecium sonneborni]|uniref:Uncharacterized protein n=1 Tax=Paramecium sonneborni TaxID=65129 RepID=A0A8S1RSI2_9CILI|nr:unnamed protein product [Paramecium sonneborni]